MSTLVQKGTCIRFCFNNGITTTKTLVSFRQRYSIEYKSFRVVQDVQERQNALKMNHVLVDHPL